MFLTNSGELADLHLPIQQTYVNPRELINPIIGSGKKVWNRQAIHIHNLSPQDVTSAPLLSSVLSNFVSCATQQGSRDCLLLAHNASFDKLQIELSLKNLHDEKSIGWAKRISWIDTRQFFKEFSSRNLGDIHRALCPNDPQMLAQAHSAAGDVNILRQLLFSKQPQHSLATAINSASVLGSSTDLLQTRCTCRKGACTNNKCSCHKQGKTCSSACTCSACKNKADSAVNEPSTE